MKMKKLFAVLLFLMMAVSAHVMTAQQMPPIPVDDAVRIGKLDCGLTYYIRHNDYPEHKVNFYIAQRVGSLQEEENQRGLAHFLEHMSFNGSEHFHGEGKGVVDYTQSLGLNFDGDLNAFTSMDETVYNINNVPSTRQSAIDSCLLILKDWSGGLLLTEEEIDKERGVVHEDWRQGQNPETRMLERQLTVMYPGSKYGCRLPIGLMSVVDNFKYKELRDYYHKWYRPDNQALVIVGDVDVDYIESRIKDLFKNCVLDPTAAQVVPEEVPDNEKMIIAIDKDKEQQYNLIRLMFKQDATPREEKGNVGYYVKYYILNMMCNMLNGRLTEKAQEPDCPFIGGVVGYGSYLISKTKDALTLACMPKDGQSEAATQSILTEALRAAKYGFTATEYDRARDEYLSQLEQGYNERDKISNDSYGKRYYRHYLDNEPIPSSEQSYQILSMLAQNIGVEYINQALPELLKEDEKNVVLFSINQEKDGAVYPTEESLRAAIAAARSAELEAYVDNVKQEPLIAQLPKKGKITKETVNDEFGFKVLELSNGARVVLKKTDFNKDVIMVRAQRRGGLSLCSEADYVNYTLTNSAYAQSGLGEFSRTELTKALSGKQVYFSPSANDPRYDIFGGSSSVKDLETLFQVVYLTFTDVRKDQGSFDNMMTQIEANLKNRDLSPEIEFRDSVGMILHNHSWRYKPFTVESLKEADYDRILELGKQITSNAADYTFYFVGPIDESTIRPLIEQYIASLPSKKGKKSNWGNIDNYAVKGSINHFSRQMEEPKAYARVYWLNRKIPFSLENKVKAEMLGMVLDQVYVKKIREDAGAAYYTSAQAWTSLEGSKAVTMVNVYVPVKPEFTDEALKIIADEMQTACDQIDASSISSIKNELLKDRKTSLKENWFWIDWLALYEDQGIDLNTGYEQIVKAQTPETIAAFARQIMADSYKIEIVMTPE